MHMETVHSLEIRSVEREPTERPGITRALPEDLEAIMAFLGTAYEGAFCSEDRPPGTFEGNEASQAELRSELTEQLADPNTQLFLARKEGEIVGTIGVTRTEDSSEADMWGFYVSPSMKGSGLAIRLFSTLLDTEQVQGASTIGLAVDEDADIAPIFYGKRGFKEPEHGDPLDYGWPGWISPDAHVKFIKMEVPVLRALVLHCLLYENREMAEKMGLVYVPGVAVTPEVDESGNTYLRSRRV